MKGYDKIYYGDNRGRTKRHYNSECGDMFANKKIYNIIDFVLVSTAEPPNSSDAKFNKVFFKVTIFGEFTDAKEKEDSI